MIDHHHPRNQPAMPHRDVTTNGPRDSTPRRALGRGPDTPHAAVVLRKLFPWTHTRPVLSPSATARIVPAEYSLERPLDQASKSTNGDWKGRFTVAPTAHAPPTGHDAQQSRSPVQHQANRIIPIAIIAAKMIPIRWVVLVRHTNRVMPTPSGAGARNLRRPQTRKGLSTHSIRWRYGTQVPEGEPRREAANALRQKPSIDIAHKSPWHHHRSHTRGGSFVRLPKILCVKPRNQPSSPTVRASCSSPLGINAARRDAK